MKFFGTFFCDRLYVYDSVLYTEFCFEYDSVMFILKNCKSYFFSKKSFLQKKAYSVMFLEKSIDLFGLICVIFSNLSPQKRIFLSNSHNNIYETQTWRNNADRSRAAKTVGEPHLYRRLHLFPGDARREHLPPGGGADSWGADRENRLPFSPGRAQN